VLLTRRICASLLSRVPRHIGSALIDYVLKWKQSPFGRGETCCASSAAHLPEPVSSLLLQTLSSRAPLNDSAWRQRGDAIGCVLAGGLGGWSGLIAEHHSRASG
jgi:hypothetical protein